MISRSEQQMMQLIMDVATNDQRIRAVLQNGSRSNSNVTKDIFQDYDIMYVVTDLSPFIADHNWINVFGDRMILQMPEDMELYPPAPELAGAFSYLMQFMDGNRIDLVLVPIEQLSHFLEDSLCQLLLDKDGITGLTNLMPANDKTYIVRPPSMREFNDCCNEFLYTSAGLAKSIWREEVPYAKHLFHNVIQGALTQMLDWYIGCRFEFSVNPGKFGKFYKQYLEPGIYEEVLSTYRTGDINETWRAVFITIDLFRKVAQIVAELLGFNYPIYEHKHIAEYLHHVQRLPKTAKQIY